MQIILTEEEYNRLKYPNKHQTDMTIQFFITELDKVLKQHGITHRQLHESDALNNLLRDIRGILDRVRESQKT